MRLRVLPLVAAALFAVLVLSAPAAHASGVVTVDSTNSSNYSSWTVVDSAHTSVLIEDFTVGLTHRSSQYVPGGTAGQAGSVTLSGLSVGPVGAEVCTGSVPATSSGTVITGCTDLGHTIGSGGGSLSYTVPSVPYTVVLYEWSAGSTSDVTVVITANSVTPPEIPAGDWPVINLSSVSDNVAGLFGFLAPILWLVGGISIGGLLLHKARGMF